MRELCMMIDQDADYGLMLDKSAEIQALICKMLGLFKILKAEIKQSIKPKTAEDKIILKEFLDGKALEKATELKTMSE